MLIRFKTKFTGRIMGYIIAFCAVITILAFLTLPFDISSIYCLSMVITGIGFIYGFYNTRFEALTLKVADGVADFSFINKSIFKRKDMKLSLSEIRSVKEEKIIRLETAGKQFAILRQENVSPEEWKELNECFV